MTERDPFHDKLRDKGKASEDLYIEEQERKRLEKLRQAVAATKGAGTCPRDGSKLEAQKNRGLQLEICPTCRGVWLDKGEMEIAVKSENEAAVIHWVRSLFEH